jgi:hypothetical protein
MSDPVPDVELTPFQIATIEQAIGRLRLAIGMDAACLVINFGTVVHCFSFGDKQMASNFRQRFYDSFKADGFDCQDAEG